MRHFGEKLTEEEEGLGLDFHQKALPTMFIGAFIWAFSAMFFSGYFTSGILPLEFGGGFIIATIIGYIGIWITTTIFAARGQNHTAALLFYAAAFITGLMNSFVLYAAAEVIGLELAMFLFVVSAVVGVFAVAGGLIIGLAFKDKIKGNFIWSFMIFGIVLIFMESIIYMMGVTTPMMMGISGLMLIWIMGVVVYDGATLPAKIRQGYWMIAVIDIFLDFVIVVIRIFFILVQIFADR
jgi:FtsH-binding integral membrane protein